MTRAWMAGVRVEDAAIAFARDPATMRQHNLALDEQVIADRVLGQINGASKSVPAATGSQEKVAPATGNSQPQAWGEK